jgi:hypothetical protein
MYKILIGKCDERWPNGSLSRRLEDNIKMDVRM